MNKILLIEDDEAVARYIELELKHENYDLHIENTGIAGFERAVAEDFDLILLDIMLPEMSGLEVLRRIRRLKNTKIIILTAKGGVSDKVAGLDAGANDYITKPFYIEELLARIRVLFRDSERPGLIVHGDLCINTASRYVTAKDQEINLTKREYDLLLYLISNRNIVISREQIIEKVWAYDYYGDTNVVDVYIKNIRQKLEAVMDKRMIQTVRGVGYVVKD